MADRFWVGGGSANTWAATGNTNWASSSGGANNASVPSTGDVAIFDASSGSGNSVIGASIAVQKLVTTGYVGTITHNTSVTLTLNTNAADTLILASGMTYTPASTTSVVTLTATSGTGDITSNGKHFQALTCNGVGGTFRLLDDLRVDFTNSPLTVLGGTFDTNDFNWSSSLLSSTGSLVRSILAKSGIHTVGQLVLGGQQIYNFSGSNLTYNRGTGSIKIPSNGLVATRQFTGGANTFPKVDIDPNSSNGVIIFSGNNTFKELNVGFGNSLIFPTTTILETAPMWEGTQASPILVMTGSIGAVAALSCASGTVTLRKGGIRDVTGSGGAAFVAEDVMNFGNTTNWSITPPTLGIVNANIVKVNNVTVNGNGAGTPWGP